MSSIAGRSRFLTEIIRSVRGAVGEDFLIAVRISPIIEKAGIYLDDSLELAKIICQLEIDMLHISCWDVFQSVGDGNDISLTKRFRQVIPKSLPLISTGAVWDAKDAHWLIDEGNVPYEEGGDLMEDGSRYDDGEDEIY